MSDEVEVAESDDLELQSIVAAEVTDAVSYLDSDLSPERARATEYYRGDLFGNEEEDQSKIVITEVRDTVRAMMPSLLRTIFSSEKMVEFVPREMEDVPMAEQATDYVNYILSNDNDGFGVMYSTLKDSLIRKCGIVKTSWEEVEEVHNEQMTGLDSETLAVIEMQENMEIVEITEYDDPDGEPMVAGMDEETGEPILESPKLYDVEIKTVTREGKVRVDAVPPEEFILSRNATCLEDSSIVGHRKMATKAELIGLGYTEDEIDEHLASSDELEGNDEKLSRHALTSTQGMANESNNPAMQEVLYCELYIRYDYDEDGIPELRKICTMGNGYEIVNNEPADFIPFADFPYDPEPHTSPLEALSVYDYTSDLQEISSEVMRASLDSLAKTVNPQTGVVEGQVNMDDVIDNSDVIRMRAPGMVQPFSTPFVGQQAFPMLDRVENLKERRTGMSKASQGLDADAMQSSTKAAVNATISASQGQLEMTSRIVANGMKKMFKNILRIVTTHQEKARIIRLRNQWVQMDPTRWDAGMDVSINVMLGTGDVDQRLQMMNLISAKQEQILQTMGPQNPLVTFGQYSQTLHKMVELAGFKDSSTFFNQVPANWTPPPQQPQPTPEQMLAEVQVQSIQADIQKKAAELELEREQMMRKDDRERDQMEIDMYLKAAQIRAEHGAKVDTANIKAMVDRDREAIKQQANFQQPQPYTGVN